MRGFQILKRGFSLSTVWPQKLLLSPRCQSFKSHLTGATFTVMSESGQEAHPCVHTSMNDAN